MPLRNLRPSSLSSCRETATSFSVGPLDLVRGALTSARGRLPACDPHVRLGVGLLERHGRRVRLGVGRQVDRPGQRPPGWGPRRRRGDLLAGPLCSAHLAGGRLGCRRALALGDALPVEVPAAARAARGARDGVDRVEADGTGLARRPPQRSPARGVVREDDRVRRLDFCRPRGVSGALEPLPEVPQLVRQQGPLPDAVVVARHLQHAQEDKEKVLAGLPGLDEVGAGAPHSGAERGVVDVARVPQHRGTHGAVVVDRGADEQQAVLHGPGDALGDLVNAALGIICNLTL